MKRYKVAVIIACIIIFNFIISASSDSTPNLAVIKFDAEEGHAKLAEQYRTDLETNFLNTGRFKIIEKESWQKTWESLNLPYSPASLTQNPKLADVQKINYVLCGQFVKTDEATTINIRLLELPAGNVKKAFTWRSDEEKWSEFLVRFWLEIKSIFLLKGKVMKIEGNKIYLSEGISGELGVFPGDLYIIQREKEVQLNEQILGTELLEIARAKVTQVYPQFIVAEVFETKEDILPGDLAQEIPVRPLPDEEKEEETGYKHYKLVAFSSNKNGDFDIYTLDAEGKIKNLTNHPACDLDPSWGPGQTKIAFCSNRDGDYAIYILDLKTEKIERLTPPEGYISPAWSPDGKMLAFLSIRKGGEEGGIYVMNSDGSGIRRLTKNSSDSRPSWSKDSRYILFSGIRGSFSMEPDLFVLDIANNETQNISKSPAADLFPVWSPDQSQIAFISNRDGRFGIYLMDYKSLLVRRLTALPNDAAVNGMTWAPDGKSLLISYGSEGSMDLYRVFFSDGTVKKYFSSPDVKIEPAWTR